MANDINRVFLIGRLTRDPELKTTQGGTSVASFSLANNYSYGKAEARQEKVNFFNCIAWGKPGEIIAQHCKKGQRMGIEGRLQQRSWDDNNGNKRSTVEVVVENFQFLSAKQEGEDGDKGQYSPPQSEGPSHFDDTDIPF